jgi:hypothetical protein
MYTNKNFKSKKELKAAVEAWNKAVIEHGANGNFNGVGPVTYYQPGPFAGNEPKDGTIYVEGPHYPQPHKFYAACIVKDGVIVKVK